MTIHSSTPAWKISRIEEPDSSNPWVQTESDMIEKMSTFMYTWDYLLETFNNMTSISCSLRKVSSFLFSHSVVSDSLWPHGLHHAKPPCPSPTPRVHPNSCPLSWWCHRTISSSVIPFSSCLQSFPASGSFPMSQSFTSGSQSIGVSVSASVLPMNIQDWFPLGFTGLISLKSNGLSRVFSNTTVQNSSVLSFLFSSTLTSINDYWKNHSFD